MLSFEPTSRNTTGSMIYLLTPLCGLARLPFSTAPRNARDTRLLALSRGLPILGCFSRNTNSHIVDYLPSRQNERRYNLCQGSHHYQYVPLLSECVISLAYLAAVAGRYEGEWAGGGTAIIASLSTYHSFKWLPEPTRDKLSMFARA